MQQKIESPFWAKHGEAITHIWWVYVTVMVALVALAVSLGVLAGWVGLCMLFGHGWHLFWAIPIGVALAIAAWGGFYWMLVEKWDW